MRVEFAGAIFSFGVCPRDRRGFGHSDRDVAAGGTAGTWLVTTRASAPVLTLRGETGLRPSRLVCHPEVPRRKLARTGHHSSKAQPSSSKRVSWLFQISDHRCLEQGGECPTASDTRVDQLRVSSVGCDAGALLTSCWSYLLMCDPAESTGAANDRPPAPGVQMRKGPCAKLRTTLTTPGS